MKNKVGKEYSLEEWVDHRLAGEAVSQTRRVIVQGGVVAIEKPGKVSLPFLGGGRRRKITTFSKQARRRMLSDVKRCGEAKAIFVTLTYGDVWPQDKEDFRYHLKKLWNMIIYRYPELGAFWRGEIQEKRFSKSGNLVPHYHLLIFQKDGTMPFIDNDWLARAWAKASEDESSKHVKAGVEVKAVQTANGATYYCAKYMAKMEGLEWNYGKCWNRLSQKNLPYCEKEELEITDSEFEDIVNLYCERLASSRAVGYGRSMIPDELMELEEDDEREKKRKKNERRYFKKMFEYNVQNQYKEEIKKGLGDSKKTLTLYFDGLKEWIGDKRRIRQGEVRLMEALVTGTMPERWYEKQGLSRDPFRDDPARDSIFEWIRQNRLEDEDLEVRPTTTPPSKTTEQRGDLQL